MATSDKKTAYKIQEIIEQLLFKRFLEIHIETLHTEPNERNRSSYSKMAYRQAKAILSEPKIEIILKRGKK